jgi:hypothetical protein
VLKKFFIALVCLWSFAQDGWASIKQIAFAPSDGGATVRLVMDRPFPLKISPESDEVFVVEGFNLNDWSIDKQGPGQGIVKEYYIEDYSSGSAELIIRTKPGFKIQDAQLNPRGSHYVYEMSFVSGDLPTPTESRGAPLMVDKVQVGQKGSATRLVMHLNRSANFNFSANSQGTEIMILPDELMRWEAQTTMDYTLGFFKGYELLDQGATMALKIKTMPGTKVGSASIQDANSSSPKYVVDLVPDTISNVGDSSMFDMQGGPAPIPGWQATPADFGAGSVPQAADTGLVQSMDILTQNDDTVVKFVTKDPLNLDVTENEYTSQVIIHLPKVNWTNVNALDRSGGLIESYKIDQSSIDGTNLILNVKKGTHVIGKKTVSGGNNQAHRFIIHLNQNEHKIPEWLVSATSMYHEKEEDNKDDLETMPMLYRGGASPTASIGQGPYAGWNLTFFGSEDKLESSNIATDASQKLFSGVTGIGGEGYVGYGMHIMDSVYLGGELSLGYYLNKQTRTYKDGDSHESTAKLGMNWGGSVRIGGYVSPTALLYMRLGAQSTDFWFKGSKESTGDVIFPGSYSKRNRTGFLYGVGLDTVFNDYTSMRFEVSQVNYQPFKYSAKNPAGQQNNVKHRFVLNQVSVGMTHHFNPMSGPAASPIYDESVVRGVYGGVLFALNNMHAKRDFKNDNTNYYSGSANTDPVWGFYTGYGKSHGRFYYAGEVDVSLSESVTKETLNFSATHSESFTDTLKWRWGAVGRLGYIFNHGVMGYVKLGLASGKFQRSHKNTIPAGSTTKFAAEKKYKKLLTGIRTGAGLEVTVNNVLGIRGDWTLDYYPKVVIKGDRGGTEKQKIIDNRFGVGLTIYLSDMLSSMGLGTNL